MAWRHSRRGASRSIARSVAYAFALLALLACAASASAQPLATTQSQTTYAAFDPWTAWEWWQPNKCQETQPVYISEPTAAGRYPVLFYMHGTLADWGGNAEGQRVAQLAASQGFVAAAVTYDSWVTAYTPTGIDGHAECIFGSGNTGNALKQVCALAKAECSNGVVVAGFSQGGAIAVRAANYSSQVRAAWAMGVNGPAIPEALAAPAGARALPNDKLRLDVGESDAEGAYPGSGPSTGLDLSALNAMTGMSCTASPCLAPDGSGYFVVQDAEVADGVADHCYWESVDLADPAQSCTLFPTFDPGFIPPSTKPWSLIANLEWLRAQLASADPPPAHGCPHAAPRVHGRCRTKRR